MHVQNFTMAEWATSFERKDGDVADDSSSLRLPIQSIVKLGVLFELNRLKIALRTIQFIFIYIAPVTIKIVSGRFTHILLISLLHLKHFSMSGV